MHFSIIIASFFGLGLDHAVFQLVNITITHKVPGRVTATELETNTQSVLSDNLIELGVINTFPLSLGGRGRYKVLLGESSRPPGDASERNSLIV